ncbi:MAG: hypothetical protein J6S58_11100, partial [Lentisphaeria bacterium]|nr:hypothetical protein [Lentisphaeria bacterium]
MNSKDHCFPVALGANVKTASNGQKQAGRALHVMGKFKENLKSGWQEFCKANAYNPLQKFLESEGEIWKGGEKLFFKISPFAPLKTARFTLIELLVSTACKIGVLPLYSLKKMSMSSLSENFTDLYTLKFFKKQRQGSKDFSAGKNFDPILKFLRESGGVRGGGREAFFKK